MRNVLLISICLLLSNGISRAVYKGEDLVQIETQSSRFIDTVKEYGEPFGRSFVILAAATGVGLFLGTQLDNKTALPSHAYKAKAQSDETFRTVFGTIGWISGAVTSYYYAKENQHNYFNVAGGLAGFFSTLYIAAKMSSK